MDGTKQTRNPESAESNLLRLAEENAVMAEIGRIISSSTDITEIYEQFGEVVGKLLRLDRINVTLADTKCGTAEAAYAWGIPLAGIEPGGIYPLDGTIVRQVIEKQSPLVAGAKDVRDLALHWELTEQQKTLASSRTLRSLFGRRMRYLGF